MPFCIGAISFLGVFILRKVSMLIAAAVGSFKFCRCNVEFTSTTSTIWPSKFEISPDTYLLLFRLVDRKKLRWKESSYCIITQKTPKVKQSCCGSRIHPSLLPDLQWDNKYCWMEKCLQISPSVSKQSLQQDDSDAGQQWLQVRLMKLVNWFDMQNHSHRRREWREAVFKCWLANSL